MNCLRKKKPSVTCGCRIVPIAPELLPILEKARELADKDVKLVVTGVIHINVWRDFGVIRKRAGIENYEKWCHTLRKNRESDWIAAGFPFHVVVKWMGHSDEVARQHYLRVNDSDLAAALKETEGLRRTSFAITYCDL